MTVWNAFGDSFSVICRKLPAALLMSTSTRPKRLDGGLDHRVDGVGDAHVAGRDEDVADAVLGELGGGVEDVLLAADESTSLAPSSPKRCAIDFPRPVPPPVTTMTLPFNRLGRKHRYFLSFCRCAPRPSSGASRRAP